MKARRLVALSLGAVFAAAATLQSVAGDLSFSNTHTGETLTADPDTAEGRRQINHILRDHRRNKDAKISAGLLDLLGDIKTEIKKRHPDLDVVFHIISGYRSPETNSKLRRTRGRGGQALHSRHVQNDAIDIRVPGLSTRELRDIAWCLQRGGVGYYQDSDFVHIDMWTKRTKDDRFPGDSRLRAWGWTPQPDMCK